MPQPVESLPQASEYPPLPSSVQHWKKQTYFERFPIDSFLTTSDLGLKVRIAKIISEISGRLSRSPPASAKTPVPKRNSEMKMTGLFYTRHGGLSIEVDGSLLTSPYPLAYHLLEGVLQKLGRLHDI